jgi:penicillin amidase
MRGMPSTTSFALTIAPTIALALILGCEAPSTYELEDDVEIFRDSLGVVHIYAQSDEDVMYASGYMQAHDRLFQMDLTRRRALGRRAEILGAGAVDDDAMIRRMGIPRWAREAADRMRDESPDEYRLLVAWTSGVNAFIAEVNAGTAPLPYGFGPSELDYAPEPWEPMDGVAVGKLILFGNANQLELDLLATIIRDLLPQTFERIPLMRPLVGAYVVPPEERPVDTSSGPLTRTAASAPSLSRRAREWIDRELLNIVPSITARYASNNWALEGRHTASGTPLLAGDPHQPLRTPSLFWMQHMSSADAGGTLDVAGFSFVGTPLVQLGHNGAIGWTATTSYPDISDLWEVRSDGITVNAGGEQITIVRREELIEVRGSDPETLVVEEVPGYGVLLPEDLTPVPIVSTGARMLFDWTGFRVTHEASAFLAMNRAQSLEDFEAGVDRMEIGCFNFLAASSGGIAYRSSPLVPVRGAGATDREHWAMLDGDDPETFWTDDILPLSQLPHSRGGERGWIASANNDPLGFTADGTTAGDPYYFGVFFDPGTRAGRIEDELERLTARGAVTEEEMQALQMDAHSLLADALVPVISEAWAAVPTDEALAEFRGRTDLETLVTLVTAWDRRMTREQAAPVAFDVFMFFAANEVLADDFLFLFGAILGEEPAYMMKWLVGALRGDYPRAGELLPQGRDVAVLRALDATSDWLTERFGGVEPSLYTWGVHHGSRFPSEWGERLDGAWVPTDGGVGTVNVSSSSFLNDGGTVARLESTGGALFRIVLGFDDGDGSPRASVNVSRGTSGDPDSPFLANTTEDWIEGRYSPLLFRRDEAEADLVESWELGP